MPERDYRAEVSAWRDAVLSEATRAQPVGGKLVVVAWIDHVDQPIRTQTTGANVSIDEVRDVLAAFVQSGARPDYGVFIDAASGKRIHVPIPRTDSKDS